MGQSSLSDLQSAVDFSPGHLPLTETGACVSTRVNDSSCLGLVVGASAF